MSILPSSGISWDSPKKIGQPHAAKGGTCKNCWDLMSKVAISPVIQMMMEMVMAPCGIGGWTPTRARLQQQ